MKREYIGENPIIADVREISFVMGILDERQYDILKSLVRQAYRGNSNWAPDCDKEITLGLKQGQLLLRMRIAKNLTESSLDE